MLFSAVFNVQAVGKQAKMLWKREKLLKAKLFNRNNQPVVHKAIELQSGETLLHGLCRQLPTLDEWLHTEINIPG